MFNYDDEHASKGAFIAVLIISLVFLISVGILAKFTLLDKKAIEEPTNIEYNNGKTPYEIAHDLGFSGTYEEWTDSLKGSSGENGKTAYELALEYNFFTGTEEEFYEYLKGEKGTLGDDSKSFYDYAVECGFTGTIEDFNTLITNIANGGVKGDTGEMGDTGNFIEGLEGFNTGDDLNSYTFFDFKLTDDTLISKKAILPQNVIEIIDVYPKEIQKNTDISKCLFIAKVRLISDDFGYVILNDKELNSMSYSNANYSYINTSVVGNYTIDINIGGIKKSKIISVVDGIESDVNVVEFKLEDHSNNLYAFVSDPITDSIFFNLLSKKVSIKFDNNEIIELLPIIDMVSYDIDLTIYDSFSESGEHKIYLTLPQVDKKIEFNLHVFDDISKDDTILYSIDVEVDDYTLHYDFYDNDFVKVTFKNDNDRVYLYSYSNYSISGDEITIDSYENMVKKFTINGDTLSESK